MPKQDPSFVAAVHGKFSPASLEKIAKLTSTQTTKIGGGLMVELGGSQPAVALTKDGVLLAGTPKLVRDRLADTWQAPARTAGGEPRPRGRRDRHQAGVRGSSIAMSPTARKAALDELGPKKNFLTDVIQRHKAATFAMLRRRRRLDVDRQRPRRPRRDGADVGGRDRDDAGRADRAARHREDR